jgi:hypothetical protein
MDELGEPISYLTLEPGVPVFSSDGERAGKVVRVLAAPEANMFDGIIIDTTAGPGGHRFVDAAAVASLPKPGANPAALSVSPDDLVGRGGGGGFLGRIRDSLFGKR